MVQEDPLEVAQERFFSGWPLKMCYSPAKGRYVTASRPIKRGELVFQARPYAAMPVESYRKRVCGHCFQYNAAGRFDCKCSACTRVFYCGESCRAAHATTHSVLCQSGARVAAMKLDHDLANIVQLVAEIAIRKQAEAYGLRDADFLPPVSDEDLLYPEKCVDAFITDAERTAGSDTTAPQSPIPLLKSILKTGPASDACRSGSAVRRVSFDIPEHTSSHVPASGRVKPKLRVVRARGAKKKPSKPRPIVVADHELFGPRKARRGAGADNEDVSGSSSGSDAEGSEAEAEDDGYCGEGSDAEDAGDSEEGRQDTESNAVGLVAVAADGGPGECGDGAAEAVAPRERRKGYVCDVGFRDFEMLLGHSASGEDRTEWVRHTRNLAAILNAHAEHVSATPDELLAHVGRIGANCFGLRCPGTQDKRLGRLVVPAASFFNHSCDPNVAVEYQNLVGCFVAVADIPAGQELNIAYIDTEMPRTSRIQRLREEYDFECSCARCESEKGDRGGGKGTYTYVRSQSCRDRKNMHRNARKREERAARKAVAAAVVVETADTDPAAAC